MCEKFPSAELTTFAYGENRPMGVRYLSVTKAQLADFTQETKGFPNPSLPCKWVCLQSATSLSFSHIASQDFCLRQKRRKCRPLRATDIH